MNMRVWRVASGVVQVDKGYVTRNGFGTKVTLPVTMQIIQHPRGLIVVDTGANVGVSDGQCAAFWGAAVAAHVNIVQSRDEVIDRQIERLGFRLDDVKYVIHTHLHADHAGNISMFPSAKHVVQRDELRGAWWPEKFQRGGYMLRDFEATRNFDFLQLDGDFDLFGDGSVTLLDTKGHTAGHQSVMLKLPRSGHVLIAGDALDTAENEEVSPLNDWSVYQARRSVERLKNLREAYGAEIWYSHDHAQYEGQKGKVFE